MIGSHRIKVAAFVLVDIALSQGKSQTPWLNTMSCGILDFHECIWESIDQDPQVDGGITDLHNNTIPGKLIRYLLSKWRYDIFGLDITNPK